MEESGIIDFVKKNKDIQCILKELIDKKGTIEIVFEKGRIKKKFYKKEF